MRSQFLLLAAVAAAALPISAQSIAPSTLPDATLSQVYNAVLTSTPSSASTTWSISSGALPPNLTLAADSQGNGVISGTPIQAGSFLFTVQAVVPGSPNVTITQSYSLNVTGITLSITQTTMPGGVIPLAYQYSLTATGGTAPYTWAFSSGTATNANGLTINSTTGVISGTPIAGGTFPINVTVTDSTSARFTRDYLWNVLQITTTSLPNGVQGQAYSAAINAVGVTPPASWRISSGALPPGLNIDAGTGSISGTPQLGGTFNFTVAITDQQNTAYQAYTVTIASQPPGITTTSLPNGAVGVAYSQTVHATGGTPPYSWSVTAGALPGGLTLDPSSGAIAGTPTTAGSFPFTMTVTDAASKTSSQNFTIVVTNFQISTTSLPNGTVSVAYSQTLAATGGTAPYTWAITSGSLPPGLTLDPSSGSITGIPTATGTSNFTITVTDAASLAASKSLSIQVDAFSFVITTTSLPSGFTTVPYSATLAASGAPGPVTWSVISGSLPPNVNLDSATGAITGSPTTAGNFSFTIGASSTANGSTFTTSKALSIVIAALPQVTITGLPASAAPGQQMTATISRGGDATTPAMNVTLTLAFTRADGGDNPEVRFSNGTRTANVALPTGVASPTATVTILAGTAAGTITLTASVTDTGNNPLPAPAPITIPVNATVPVISSVSIQSFSGGFNVVVKGFSSPRDMVSGLFHFAPTTSTNLTTTDITVQLASAFTTWYSNPSSAQYGSQFSLTVPFTIQGNAAAPVAAVTVTLTNSKGTSNVSNPANP